MTCRTENVRALTYRFCPDDPPPAASRTRAVLRARVLDEITREPVEVELSLTSTVLGLTPRSAAGGLVGLVGQPGRSLPGLGLAPVDLDLRVEAGGFLPSAMLGTLGPIPGFPGQFAPLDLGDVGLHRRAVAFRGRTRQRASLAPTVVAGAQVSIVGYWPTFPPASVSPPSVMRPPNLVNLAPGAYAARAGIATLSPRAVPPLPGEDKRLQAPAAAGARRLRLSNRTALAVGTPLIVDDGDPGRRERILVEDVTTDSAVDLPAWVTLAHPLAHLHREGALCRVGALQPPGPASPLVRDAIPGDETVFLGSAPGFASGSVVEIDDGISPPEYHEARLYRATSDAEGRFRLPPISRVAMVLLHADSLALTAPDDERVTPDYRLAENRIAVTFP